MRGPVGDDFYARGLSPSECVEGVDGRLRANSRGDAGSSDCGAAMP